MTFRRQYPLLSVPSKRQNCLLHPTLHSRKKSRIPSRTSKSLSLSSLALLFLIPPLSMAIYLQSVRSRTRPSKHHPMMLFAPLLHSFWIQTHLPMSSHLHPPLTQLLRLPQLLPRQPTSTIILRMKVRSYTHLSWDSWPPFAAKGIWTSRLLEQLLLISVVLRPLPFFQLR